MAFALVTFYVICNFDFEQIQQQINPNPFINFSFCILVLTELYFFGNWVYRTMILLIDNWWLLWPVTDLSMLSIELQHALHFNQIKVQKLILLARLNDQWKLSCSLFVDWLTSSRLKKKAGKRSMYFYLAAESWYESICEWVIGISSVGSTIIPTGKYFSSFGKKILLR